VRDPKKTGTLRNSISVKLFFLINHILSISGLLAEGKALK